MDWGNSKALERESKKEWPAWVKGIYLTDGHHVSDSSGPFSGLGGGAVFRNPFRSWGLSGLWLLRIELADTAEEKCFLQFLPEHLICSAKVF